MKYIILTLFFFVISCSNAKKNYVCGDHKCIDKKEFDEYFARNLTIEINLPKKENKDKSLDLVKLNTEDDIDKKKKFNLFNLNKNKDNALNKNSKKLAKNKIKEEEKIKKLILKEKKSKQKELEKKLKLQRKLDKNNERKNSQAINIKNKLANTKKKIAPNKSENRTTSANTAQSESKIAKKETNIVVNNFCSDIKNCDIDKISDLLTKESENKDFPDINIK